MRKTLILSILPVILFFYFYRLSFEEQKKKAVLMLEYAAFANYFHRIPAGGSGLIREMKRHSVLAILFYPAVVADLINEYNEVLLVKGAHPGSFPSPASFRKERLYLFIPDSLKGFGMEGAAFQRKFRMRGGWFYEYNEPPSVLLSRPVRYRRPHEEFLRQNGIAMIQSKNRPLMKKTDEFLLLEGDTGQFCETMPQAGKSLKVHLFQKKINSKRDLEIFYRENARAVLERSVNGVILPLMNVDKEIVPWEDLAPPLSGKLRGAGTVLVKPAGLLDAPEFKNAFLLAYRIIAVFYSLLLVYLMCPSCSPWLFFLSAALLLWDINGFILIMAGLAFYLLNAYFISRNMKGGFGPREAALYLLLLIVSGVHVSNFLFHPKNTLDASAVPFVKLIYLAPFFLLAFQFLRQKKYSLKKLMESPVRFKEALLFSAVFLVLVILLDRSGGTHSGISPLELRSRRILESVFFARPRFKEIFGYFFFFSLVLWRRHKMIKEYSWYAYTAGLIGVSGTMNSFLHIHTVSSYTLLRSATGIALGLSGALFLGLFMRIKTHAEKHIR